MSTYEKFMVILTAGILLVAILENVHKKWPSYLDKVNGYFQLNISPGWVSDYTGVL